MSELLRLLGGFTSIGSGLTFFALTADALLLPGGGTTAVALGVAAGLWAAVLTAWGVLALSGSPARNRVTGLLSALLPAVLPAAAAVVLAALAWKALLAPAGSRQVDLTLASALVLVLLQFGIHSAFRRRAGRVAGPRLSPGKLLGSLFLSAVVVAGITTPGLAASTAGDHAVPHSGHGPAPAPEGHQDH